MPIHRLVEKVWQHLFMSAFSLEPLRQFLPHGFWAVFWPKSFPTWIVQMPLCLPKTDGSKLFDSYFVWVVISLYDLGIVPNPTSEWQFTSNIKLPWCLPYWLSYRCRSIKGTCNSQNRRHPSIVCTVWSFLNFNVYQHEDHVQLKDPTPSKAYQLHVLPAGRDLPPPDQKGCQDAANENDFWSWAIFL